MLAALDAVETADVVVVAEEVEAECQRDRT